MLLLRSFLASVHHIAAFTMVACLVYEALTLRRSMSASEVRRIQSVDLWYGLSALVLLGAGTIRVFYEKNPIFYATNSTFWIKIALVITVGVLSIYPTIRFIRWGKLADDATLTLPVEEHARIQLFLRIQIIGIGLILFAAPAMARGLKLF